MYGLSNFEQIAILVVLGIAILGLLYAIFLRSQILKEDKGTEKMLKVWNAIKDGADTYLKRQLKSILPLMALLTLALFASVYIVKPTPEASEWYCMAFKGVPPKAAAVCGNSLTPAESQQLSTLVGLGRALAFVMGAASLLPWAKSACAWQSKETFGSLLQLVAHLVTLYALPIVPGRSPVC
jgi:K(+)-stimulated pyrophosphate-energized sodium pump